MKPTTLIFDWHGVLDHVTFESFVKKPSLPVQKIKKIIHEDERAYSSGRITPEKFWQIVRKKIPVSRFFLKKIQKYVISFSPNEVLWEKLPELKERYQLAILSDCPADKLAVIKKKADLSFFKTTHFSCEQHLTKDKDAFFLKLVQVLGEKPAECLYIDDSELHIAAAQRLGFQTHLFTTADKLLAEIL
jgi:HAD superfamily hydrolase (TIGR01509 family)